MVFLALEKRSFVCRCVQTATCRWRWAVSTPELCSLVCSYRLLSLLREFLLLPHHFTGSFVLVGMGGQDTEGGFNWSRYQGVVTTTVEHVNTFMRAGRDGGMPGGGELTVQKVLDSTHLKKPADETALLADVLSLPVFLTEHPDVHLVVIDSIAFPFQKGVDDRAFGTTRIVALIMQSLAMTASDYKCTVIVTNHITVKPVIKSSSSSAATTSSLSLSRAVPSMGEGFGHLSAVRLHFLWVERVRCVVVDKMMSGISAQSRAAAGQDGIGEDASLDLIPFAVTAAGIRSTEIVVSD